MRRGTLGGVASVVLGAAYMFALASDVWGHESSWPLLALVATFAAGAFLSTVVLCAWARPASLWSLPGLFSAPLLLLASSYLWDLGGMAIFLAIAAATFLVCVAGCLVVRAIVAVRHTAP